MGCASLKTQTPPYPLLLSVKWPDMFGEWDTGVWAGLCVSGQRSVFVFSP